MNSNKFEFLWQHLVNICVFSSETWVSRRYSLLSYLCMIMSTSLNKETNTRIDFVFVDVFVRLNTMFVKPRRLFTRNKFVQETRKKNFLERNRQWRMKKKKQIVFFLLFASWWSLSNVFLRVEQIFIDDYRTCFFNIDEDRFARTLSTRIFWSDQMDLCFLPLT